MRMSHYCLILLMVFSCAAVAVFHNTDMKTAAQTVNVQYADYLTSATYDAVATATESGEVSFATEASRERAVSTMFESLSLSFHVKNSSNEPLLSEFIPVIAIIDHDGMYVNYRHKYTDSSGHSYVQRTTSPISTWSKTYDIFNIRYYLGNEVEVTLVNNGKVNIEGDRNDVFEALTDLYTSGQIMKKPSLFINFLTDDKKFKEERNQYIIDAVNKQLDYYINNCNNEFRNSHEVYYSYTMPKTSSEDWARVLSGPTIISFMQGQQPKYWDGFLNIYALAGGEIISPEKYYITEEDGHYYYHINGCSHTAGRITDCCYTMDRCAEMGAYPCKDCIR